MRPVDRTGRGGGRRAARVARGLAAATLAGLLLPAAAPVRAQLASDLDAFERKVAAAVAAVEPSVVALAVETEAETGDETKWLALLRGRTQDRLSTILYSRPPNFLASGVVVSPQGHILTSYQNVRGNLRRVSVRQPDGGSLAATLVGFDQKKDLALLQADLPRAVVPPTVSAPPKIGDWVVAIGRVPDPARPTATVGIVSARKRLRGSAVQFDAKLNYGNAGGALVDLSGRMVGVTCNIRERAQWGQNSGVGFAVTWDAIEEVLPRLKGGMRAAVPPTPYIGVRPAAGALDVEGAPIDEVIPGSPAAQAGLQDGDLVVRVDDQPIRRWEELVEAVRKKKAGDWIRVIVDRLGEKKTFRIQVGLQDDDD